MGSRIYDFLTESFLFEGKLLDETFASIPEGDLVRELHRYRDFVLKIQADLVAEVCRSESSLKVFSGLDRVRLSELKQCALYVHQYIIDDPLLPLAAEKTQSGEVFSKAIGFAPSAFDKEELATKLRFMKMLTPMIAADFVKLLPISSLFEPPKELPMFYSENQFSDGLPRVLMEKFHARAEVKSMKKSECGFIITDDLFPCRQIHIGFQDHPVQEGMMFSLFDIDSMTDEGENRFGLSMTLPDVPPSLTRFQHWVVQSINKTAIAVHNKLLTEIAIAADLGAVYSTRSGFIGELLEAAVPTRDSISTNTANVFLNIELPFLADIDASTLMRIRNEDGEAFERFRLELDVKLRELRAVDDPDEARVKAENAIHELTEVQVHDVKAKMASVKEKAALMAVMATVGFLAAVQTAGWSLLSVAAAAMTGAQAGLDYRKDVKRHPAFFMWKLKEQSRRGSAR